MQMSVLSVFSNTSITAFPTLNDNDFFNMLSQIILYKPCRIDFAEHNSKHAV